MGDPYSYSNMMLKRKGVIYRDPSDVLEKKVSNTNENKRQALPKTPVPEMTFPTLESTGSKPFKVVSSSSDSESEEDADQRMEDLGIETNDKNQGDADWVDEENEETDQELLSACFETSRRLHPDRKCEYMAPDALSKVFKKAQKQEQNKPLDLPWKNQGRCEVTDLRDGSLFMKAHPNPKLTVPPPTFNDSLSYSIQNAYAEGTERAAKKAQSPKKSSGSKKGKEKMEEK